MSTNNVPALTAENVRGVSPQGNPRGDQKIADYDAAEKALERADAKELFVLYEKAIRDRNEIETLFTGMTSIYMGKDNRPNLHSLTPPTDNAVAAMERIALAAIDLARHVAGIKPDER